MLYKISAVTLFVFDVVFGQSVGPIVQTDVGLIRGLQSNDGDYSMFLGIPFGKVDENNPFGASEPYPHFENIFEGNDDSDVCPQFIESDNALIGTLDCLRMNVYVPNSATANNRLPVLVWIHGGYFIMGNNNRFFYGPKFLVNYDVIVVTINYRLGAYGFMCVDSPKAPGNQGIKDQVLALRWINRNIRAFGGNDDKITVFGQSAGSMALDMHLTSNSEKLFNQAILQSGTLFTPLYLGPFKTAPQVLARHLGYATDNTDDALNFLATIDISSVVKLSHELGLNVHFRPCIEKSFEGVESIMTENWLTVDLPKVDEMPIIIGYTNDERYGEHTSDDDEYYQNLNITKTILGNGFDIHSDDFPKEMEDIVKRFYFGDNEMSAAVRRDLINFDSDFIYYHPTSRNIYKYLDNGAKNVYLYMFSYLGQRNFMRIMRNITSGTGALHSDELGYQFDVAFLQDPITPEDQQVIDQMSLLWSNFAKYGDPTPEISDLLPVKWTPVTDKLTLPYLEIGSQLTVGSRPFSDRTAFWDLFYEANEQHQIPYPGAHV